MVVAWEAGACVMMTVLPGAMLVITVALSDAADADVALVTDDAAAVVDDEAAADDLAELDEEPDEEPPP